MVGVSDAASALKIIRHFLGLSGAQLCGAELMWQEFAHFNAAAHGVAAGQMPLDAPAVLLLEIACGDDDVACQLMEDGLAGLWEEAGIIDAVVARSLDQRDRLWHLREDTETIYRHYPGAASYDVSVPASQADTYVARIMAGFTALDPALKPYVFGHIADGNLHIIFNRPGALDETLSAQVDAVLYTGLAQQGGSFSAEHGVGVKKRPAYELYADPVKRAVARSIKQALDPNNLFNPGKVVAL
jgi:FAD/FMN-containing dehydrogenase